MKSLFCLLSVSLVTAAVAEKQPLERYQSVIDRQMFGELPKGFDPMKLPSEVAKGSSRKELTKEQEKLQSSIHFSVVNRAADGTPAVGFTDNSNPKSPVHHYLKVGEEGGGWKVVAADPAEASMTVEKDGVELVLKLGDNSAKGGKTSGGAAVPAVASETGRRSGLLGTLSSRRRLRLERQEAEKKRQEEERAKRDQEQEELRQQLQDLREDVARQREENDAAKKAAVEKKESTDENNDAQ